MTKKNLVLTISGKKKSPIMLLSWSPALGRGTSKSINEPLEKQTASQRLNMLLQSNLIVLPDCFKISLRK
jgi:hypothetical protein